MSAVPRITRLPASAHLDMPWKNGLGRTAEIAREPVAGDGFDWRLSIATIAADGAFSAFPGCARTLVPIAGGGLALDFADGTTITGQLFEPMSFSGDAPCHGRLLAGPARDLNVITRRAAMRHAVEVVAARGPLACRSAITVVVALQGASTLSVAGESWRLEPDDALRIDGAGAHFDVRADAPDARLALIGLDPGPG